MHTQTRTNTALQTKKYFIDRFNINNNFTTLPCKASNINKYGGGFFDRQNPNDQNRKRPLKPTKKQKVRIRELDAGFLLDGHILLVETHSDKTISDERKGFLSPCNEGLW